MFRAVRLAVLATLALVIGPATAAAAPLVPVTGPRDVTDMMDLPDGPLDPQTQAGSLALGMAPRFVALAREGLELLYRRDYKRFRAFFVELEAVYPGTAVASIADVLAWQAIMLENFDFRYDAAYQAASASARAKLTAAMSTPGNEGWEHFMMAGVVGIESIHAARRGRYLPALTLAFEAIDQAEKTRTVAPDFVDLRLADGLYAYWRSALSGRIKLLPNFGDAREQGLDQMMEVVRDGVFLAAPARLALAFSYLEENDFDRAEGMLLANRLLYPDNLINEQMLGVTRMYAMKLDDAMRSFQRVLAIDPKARRVRYYVGVTHVRARRFDAAIPELRTYLSYDGLEPYQVSWANYRLGRALEGLKRWAEAVDAYQAAVKADGHDESRKRLDHLRKLKRDGRIAY